ncbi:unnamed protein product [Caenorhabditis sp. 36 PRJEB53466]|nr:unnamed protein product [Caenorhabditis sp. 36 PRJEB53466]
MRLIIVQILLVFFVSVFCDKYCAVTDFNPRLIFDTSSGMMGPQNIEYVKQVDHGFCYISFYSETLPSNLAVERISDCSQHFSGQVKAGPFDYQMPKELNGRPCFYQHNWIFCICSNSYCNSPQHWPLIVARFMHNSTASTRKESDIDLAQDVKFSLKLEKVKIGEYKSDQRENLRCLHWYADSLNQEQPNPPFYLFNYITVKRDAPSLEDALHSDPRPRVKNHLKEPRKLPYVDEDYGSKDKRSSERTGRKGTDDGDGGGFGGMIAAIVGGLLYVAFLGATVYFLNLLCRRLQDHSVFPRVNDKVISNRYDRLHNSEEIPKAFLRKKKKGSLLQKLQLLQKLLLLQELRLNLQPKNPKSRKLI